ncbi:VOC family protein [Planctomonas psychrotolerans]|uniref:VOC family protein n=1 Tax=Planctomonas psychrotolerans TaxID=2528712 RepID=UPI001D0D7DA4|nr:VOC family protein [Planctomonas psychrotolerans]
MTVSVTHITFDCSDPYRLSLFWADATGFLPDPDDPNEPGTDEAYLADAHGPTVLLFIRVPEGKIVKNRVHLDVSPTDATRDEEVERLRGLGATLVDDRRDSDGTGWVVLADPEGNEFCVERSAAERATPVEPMTD